MTSLFRNPWAQLLLLWCAVLVSAAGAVYTRHRAREQFATLERLHRERDRLEVTWGQLQIEHSLQSSNAFIEGVAATRLKMAPPDPASIQLVAP